MDSSPRPSWTRRPPHGSTPRQIIVTFTVEGKVVSRSRAGVGGLRVEMVDKNVGDDDVPLAAALTVRKTDGSLRIDTLVRAFDKDLRSQQQLGESKTDTEGVLR